MLGVDHRVLNTDFCSVLPLRSLLLLSQCPSTLTSVLPLRSLCNPRHPKKEIRASSLLPSHSVPAHWRLEAVTVPKHSSLVSTHLYTSHADGLNSSSSRMRKWLALTGHISIHVLGSGGPMHSLSLTHRHAHMNIHTHVEGVAVNHMLVFLSPSV